MINVKLPSLFIIKSLSYCHHLHLIVKIAIVVLDLIFDENFE